MREQNIVFPQRVIKLMMILEVLYMAFRPLMLNIILYPVRVLALVLILCLCYYLLQNNTRMNLRYFLSFFVFLFVIIGNFAAYKLPINVDNILSVVSVFSLLLLICLSDRIRVDKSVINHIYYCCLIITAIQFAYSQSSYAYWDGSRFCSFLTLGIENSNATAINLFLIFALLLITSKGQRRFLFAIAAEVILFVLIYLTHSRIILLAAVVLTILTLARRIKRIPNLIFWGLCLLPFVFVPCYMFLYNHGFENFKIMGKSLFSGRQYVFAQHLSFVSTPLARLFGNLKRNMFQNSHNGPLAIYVSVGLVGAAAYFSIMLGTLSSAQKKSATTTAAVAIGAILACFVHGCAEAALFLGGFPSIFFIFLMFVFAFSQE